MSSLTLFVRILIVSNLILLVAFIFVIGRQIDEAAEVEKKPAQVLPSTVETPERMSEDQVLSALPKARRSSRTNRLNALDLLIGRIKHSNDFRSVRQLHSELLGRERAGYDTKIERGIVQFRLGELDGKKAIWWLFNSDNDRAENAHGMVLEGWAHAEPHEALAWWRALPQGNKRQSLLTPLVQGYLSAPGSDWKTLARDLTGDELSACVLALMDHAQGDTDPGELIDLLEEEFASASVAKRNRIAVRVNDAIVARGDLETLARWHDATEDDVWLISEDRHKQIVRQIGAIGGPQGLDWAIANSEDDLMRVALGWVKADAGAATSWLEKNRLAEGADQVAFQLAIGSVVANPNQAREWAQCISDENLAETLEGIIASYEDK